MFNRPSLLKSYARPHRGRRVNTRSKVTSSGCSWIAEIQPSEQPPHQVWVTDIWSVTSPNHGTAFAHLPRATRRSPHEENQAQRYILLERHPNDDFSFVDNGTVRQDAGGGASVGQPNANRHEVPPSSRLFLQREHVSK